MHPKHGLMNPARPLPAQPSASSQLRDAAQVIPFPSADQDAVELSAHECACLELAANGYDLREISRLLSASTFVAEETVRSLQQRARHKLKARTLAHAVAIALDRGLFELHGSPAPGGSFREGMRE